MKENVWRNGMRFTGLNAVELMGRTEDSHSHKFKLKAVSRLVYFSIPMGKEERC